MPKISVIVPVYNVEKYLNRCIDSILAQTFTDFELILVDDGSPDNCGKICDEYAAKDSRIHVIHKANGGLSDARNAGIDWTFANSDSEWITFIDSDDWIHLKYLETMFNAVLRMNCEICISAFEKTDGEPPFVDEDNLSAEQVDTESFFCERYVNAVIACGKLYKKELFRKIRFPVDKIHEDEFTTYKILFVYEKIAFISEPLYFYYNNEKSIMRKDWTPKRLNQIEGIENCMWFLKNSCHKDAYLFSQRLLLYILTEQYYSVQAISIKEKYKYLNYIKKHLRKTLRTKNSNQLFPSSQYAHYYEIAYPIEMRIYWYWQAIKQKLKRK